LEKKIDKFHENSGKNKSIIKDKECDSIWLTINEDEEE
jgi:hypothetical protein